MGNFREAIWSHFLRIIRKWGTVNKSVPIICHAYIRAGHKEVFILRYRATICALSLFLLHGSIAFFACAYGESLIFGPEFFINSKETTQRIVKTFSVRNLNQKFNLSVQDVEREKGRTISAAIDINGTRVVSPDEFDSNFKIIVKPIKLRQQNNIAVELGIKPETSIIVTITGSEEQSVTGTVFPEGSTINLDGFISVTFKAGAFSDPHDVTVYTTSSPATRNTFEAGAQGPHLPYEVRINSGNKAPSKDVEIFVNVPDSFIASDYEMHVFAQIHEMPDAPKGDDKFYLFNSAFSMETRMLQTTLPEYAFSNRYSKNGTYEAIITVGILP